MPLSHSCVAASPLSSSRAETMAWKSAPVGEAAHLPFHSGLARSSMDLGSWSSVSLVLLYTRTVERAAIPVHFPVEGANSAGTWARVSLLTSANSPAFSTCVIAGEFSVRKTSAGDAWPSWMIWLDISVSSPWRRVTLMPVSAVKASTHSLVRLSCWALYTVISPEAAPLEAAEELLPAGVPPPQAVRPRAAVAASARPASALLRIFIEAAFGGEKVCLNRGPDGAV